jgi:hypothetical protein
MGSSTGTSSPEAHTIFNTVPDAPAGTSKVALSVSTSQTVVSSLTRSPSFTFQSVIMQDSTVFPCRGMINTWAMLSPVKSGIEFGAQLANPF